MSDVIVEQKNNENPSEALPNPPEENGLGRNVVSLGWVAFFGGMAQDMIQPILPVFILRYWASTKNLSV